MCLRDSLRDKNKFRIAIKKIPFALELVANMKGDDIVLT